MTDVNSDSAVTYKFTKDYRVVLCTSRQGNNFTINAGTDRYNTGYYDPAYVIINVKAGESISGTCYTALTCE